MEVTFSDLLKKLVARHHRLLSGWAQPSDTVTPEPEDNVSIDEQMDLLCEISPPDAELLAIVEKEVEAENWVAVSFLLDIVWRSPVSFLEVLFRVVDAANTELHCVTEAAIDIIEVNVSPETPSYMVEKLESYLFKKFPVDDNYTINRKVVWGLERIGTPRVVETLKKGIRFPDPILRESIHKALRRLKTEMDN